MQARDNYVESTYFLYINYISTFTCIIFSLVVNGSNMFETSLISISCEQTSDGLIYVMASTSVTMIMCTANIQDDDIAHEDDEVYKLTLELVSPDPNTIDVDPGITKSYLTVVDDDGKKIESVIKFIYSKRPVSLNYA